MFNNNPRAFIGTVFDGETGIDGCRAFAHRQQPSRFRVLRGIKCSAVIDDGKDDLFILLNNVDVHLAGVLLLFDVRQRFLAYAEKIEPYLPA